MKNLNEMTAKELKEIAKEMKISNWWNLKKDVLIAKIEEAQNMTDEEKQEIADQKAKEDAALAIYQKQWRKYTARYNPIEFIEKFRSGEITLEGMTTNETPVEEKPEMIGYDGTADEELTFDPIIKPSKPVPTSGTEKPETNEDQPKPKRGALLEFDGKAQNICAWGEELGISPNTLYGRIYKMGWSIEKAFTTPARKSK